MQGKGGKMMVKVWKKRGTGLKQKWCYNQTGMESPQQINEIESKNHQNEARAKGAVKQIGPLGVRERTKAALLLIDCRISPIFPSGTVRRQWQMEADWTPELKKGLRKTCRKAGHDGGSQHHNTLPV